MTAPLVLALPLIEGETLPSYVSRNAALHEITPRDFCSGLGMRWPFLCSGHGDQLERLAWLLGTNLDRIAMWYPQKVSTGRYRVGRMTSTTVAFRRAQVRICPFCAVENFERDGPSGLFQLLEWLVCCLYRCDRHGVELMALPLAKTSHETYDVVAQILRHLPAIRDCANTATKLSKTAFETYVRERIWHGVQDDWLSGLDLAQLHRGCLTLGVMLAKMPQSNVLGLPLHMQREACHRGFLALVFGPQVLCEQIEKLRTSPRTSRPYPVGDLGVFYAWLQSIGADPAGATIVNSVRAYIIENYPVTRKLEILGKRAENTAYISFGEARTQTGLSVQFIKKLLCHLDGAPFDHAKAIKEIKISDLQRVQKFWLELCNLEEASNILALNPSQVKGLLRLGVFRTVRFGSALRYLWRNELRSCLAELEQLPMTRAGSGFMPLKDFCALRGVPLVKVLAEWRSGHLEGLLRRTDGLGLHQILVDVDAMCSRQSLELTGDLTLAETAKYLQISLTSIRKLRDAGLLKQIPKRNPDTNHQSSYISRDSILQFEKRFTTLGQVSKRFAMAPIHLARRFDRDGVASVDGLEESVRVYEWNQIPHNIEATT